jgi:hypothetical protein
MGGKGGGSSPSLLAFLTTSIPSTTRPKATARPSRWGQASVVMWKWEPFRCTPAETMDTRPVRVRSFCVVGLYRTYKYVQGVVMMFGREIYVEAASRTRFDSGGEKGFDCTPTNQGGFIFGSMIHRHTLTLPLPFSAAAFSHSPAPECGMTKPSSWKKRRPSAEWLPWAEGPCRCPPGWNV